VQIFLKTLYVITGEHFYTLYVNLLDCPGIH